MPVVCGIMQMNRLYSTNVLLNISPADENYCGASTTFTVTVSNKSGMPIPTGNVLIKDSLTDTTLGSGSLNGSGVAVIIVTSTSINDFNIYAQYSGVANEFVANTSSIVPYSIIQNPTTATAIISGSTFCINSSKTFSATVSGEVVNPSVGSVTWTAFKSPTTITLGTDSSVVGGAASINVPSGTFPSTGTWFVTATYTGNGCFSNSVSTALSVFPSTFGVDFLKEAGANEFCRATAQIFSYVVSSTLSGTINGTFVLKSSFGTTLKSVTTSGTSAGFVVQFNIPANTALSGVQNFFVQFTPISGSCYSADTSSNFGVTVSANPPQIPSSTVLAVTNSTTGDSTPPISGDDNDTYTFNITVNKVGKIGPVDGAGTLNGSATLELFDTGLGAFYVYDNNIHIFDGGSFGYGTLVVTGGLPSTTTSARVKWNGNACYGQQFSNSVSMNIIHIIS